MNTGPESLDTVVPPEELERRRQEREIGKREESQRKRRDALEGSLETQMMGVNATLGYYFADLGKNVEVIIKVEGREKNITYPINQPSAEALAQAIKENEEHPRG